MGEIIVLDKNSLTISVNSHLWFYVIQTYNMLSLARIRTLGAMHATWCSHFLTFRVAPCCIEQSGYITKLPCLSGRFPSYLFHAFLGIKWIIYVTAYFGCFWNTRGLHTYREHHMYSLFIIPIKMSIAALPFCPLRKLQRLNWPHLRSP